MATVPQVRRLSSRRLYKAYYASGIGIEGFAERVRGFHPELRKTSVKQLTRWHAGAKPRQPELVVAAYAAITDTDEGFFYTTSEEDEEESRVRMIRDLAGRSARGENVASELLELAALSDPMTRERVA